MCLEYALIYPCIRETPSFNIQIRKLTSLYTLSTNFVGMGCNALRRNTFLKNLEFSFGK